MKAFDADAEYCLVGQSTDCIKIQSHQNSTCLNFTVLSFYGRSRDGLVDNYQCDHRQYSTVDRDFHNYHGGYYRAVF